MMGEQIHAAVLDERERQADKWNRHHLHGWGDCSSPAVDTAVKVAVLTEECGEVARAFLDRDVDGMRRELVQVAAVAWAMLEGMKTP
jgi:hypothetical protein